MKILFKSGNENIATVYIAKMESGKYLEFVESLQPPLERSEKWVLIVSTLFGCPVGCPICDAGSYYNGKLSEKEIFSQIDFLIRKKFPDLKVNVKKFKIQFARMGEPAFNTSVLNVLKNFNNHYEAPGFLPSISTVAPVGCNNFFSNLISVKKDLYADGNFQMQFSVHSTSEKYRNIAIPVKKWSLREIAKYGNTFYNHGDRKITLNFAISRDTPFLPEIIEDVFNPEIFLIKLTPVNPTRTAVKNKLDNILDLSRETELSKKIEKLRSVGFSIIESVGELEENRIGSNCGQHLLEFLGGKKDRVFIPYEYKLEKLY